MDEKQLNEVTNPEGNTQDPAEQQQQAAAEQQETARQKAMKRVRGRNAERSFADDDDEALFGAINEDADSDEAELGKYRKDSEDFNKFLNTDGRAADFLSRWRKDGSPISALVSEYGEEIVGDMTNPDNQQMVADAQKEYLEKMARSKELQDQYDQNIEQSREVRRQLIESGKYTEEQVDAAINSFGDKFEKFLVGVIDAETIESEIKAAGYDNDTAAAEQRGEVRGRNANIAAEEGRRRRQSDGLPNVQNGGGRVKSEEPKKSNGALDELTSRRSMW